MALIERILVGVLLLVHPELAHGEIAAAVITDLKTALDLTLASCKGCMRANRRDTIDRLEAQNGVHG
jgi:hypothetical protein